MPEVSLKTSEWVLKDLAKRGAYVHLDTQVTGAVDGNVELSTGETIPTDLIIWTAGVMANPTVVRGGDLPSKSAVASAPAPTSGSAAKTRSSRAPGLPETSRRFPTSRAAVSAATACPTHSTRSARRSCSPRTSTGVLRGELPREYYHKNIGAVAGLGLYNGVFQSGNLALKGFVAWLAHRGYHGLAMPSWERKWRVLWGWWNNFWLAPRPGEPVDRAEPALRVRGVRGAPASAAARGGGAACAARPSRPSGPRSRQTRSRRPVESARDLSRWWLDVNERCGVALIRARPRATLISQPGGTNRAPP